MYETIPLISFSYTCKLIHLTVICVSVPSTVISTDFFLLTLKSFIHSWELEDQGLKLSSRDCLSGITKYFQTLSHSAAGIASCFYPSFSMPWIIISHKNTEFFFHLQFIFSSYLFKEGSRHILEKLDALSDWIKRTRMKFNSSNLKIYIQEFLL